MREAPDRSHSGVPQCDPRTDRFGGGSLGRRPLADNKGMMSKKHRHPPNRAALDDLSTTASKESLADLALDYLTSMRPYLDRTRELEEKVETVQDREDAGADYASLLHNEQVEHCSDAVADVFSTGPDSDRHFLLYELLCQSGNPYAEAWVLTYWQDDIRPPFPPALRDLVRQAIERTPSLTPAATELGWLN
jgi:hypothetical protein